MGHAGSCLGADSSERRRASPLPPGLLEPPASSRPPPALPSLDPCGLSGVLVPLPWPPASAPGPTVSAVLSGVLVWQLEPGAGGPHCPRGCGLGAALILVSRHWPSPSPREKHPAPRLSLPALCLAPGPLPAGSGSHRTSALTGPSAAPASAGPGPPRQWAWAHPLGALRLHTGAGLPLPSLWLPGDVTPRGRWNRGGAWWTRPGVLKRQRRGRKFSAPCLEG